MCWLLLLALDIALGCGMLRVAHIFVRVVHSSESELKEKSYLSRDLFVHLFCNMRFISSPEKCRQLFENIEYALGVLYFWTNFSRSFGWRVVVSILSGNFNNHSWRTNCADTYQWIVSQKLIRSWLKLKKVYAHLPTRTNSGQLKYISFSSYNASLNKSVSFCFVTNLSSSASKSRLSVPLEDQTA